MIFRTINNFNDTTNNDTTKKGCISPLNRLWPFLLVIFGLFSLRLMGMGFVYLFGLWLPGVTRVITIPFAVFIINKLLIKYNLSD